MTELRIVSPRSAFCWTAAVLSVLSIVRFKNQTEVKHEGAFGRYTERDVLRIATPVILAMIPNRADLYIGAEHAEVTMANRQVRHMWSVECTDGLGIHLIHINIDADSGRIATVGYEWYKDLPALRQSPLTAAAADLEARRWMHRLGNMEEWKLVAPPEHRIRDGRDRNTRWVITMARPGWQAHLCLDHKTGTLVFADLIPEH